MEYNDGNSSESLSPDMMVLLDLLERTKKVEQQIIEIMKNEFAGKDENLEEDSEKDGEPPKKRIKK